MIRWAEKEIDNGAGFFLFFRVLVMVRVGFVSLGTRNLVGDIVNASVGFWHQCFYCTGMKLKIDLYTEQ